MHIAISDQTVKDRVLRGGYDEASMFLNHELAEAAISRVFDVKRTEIAAWFNSKKVGARMDFPLEFPLGQRRILGKSFASGASEFESAHSAIVVLKKVSKTEFRILTAYPSNKVR